jgi:hypothetical protein
MDSPFRKKKWTKQERDQIRPLTKIDMIKLLDKDPRWKFLGAKGGRYIYGNPKCPKPYDHVAIHYHKEGFHNLSLLLQLIDNICWTAEDLRNWKVIK